MDYDRLSEEDVPTFKNEICALLGIAWPIALYLSTQFIQVATDFALLGHYDTKYLAGATLADSWMLIPQVLIRATWLPLNTLVGQAYGAKNFHLCSIWCQMGIFVSLMAAIPVGICYAITPFVLRLLHQDRDTIPYSTTYARWMILSLLPYSGCGAIRAYLSGLKMPKPAAFTQLISIFFNFALAYVLLFHVLGYVGTPIATSSTRLFTLIIYCIYVFGIGKLHKETWTPWNCKNYSQKRWKTLIGFVIPSILSQAAELWSFQIICFFAGNMGKNEIAVMNFSQVIFMLFNSCAIGIALAANVRISHYLGAGNPSNAQHTFKSAMIIVSIFGTISGAFMFFGKSLVANMISNDPKLHHIFYDISPFLAVALVTICYLTVMILVSLGQGRPALVASILGPCTWFINIPAAYVFAFKLEMGISGLWVGISCGYGIALILFIYFIFNSDWQLYADEARRRSEAVTDVQDSVSTSPMTNDAAKLSLH